MGHLSRLLSRTLIATALATTTVSAADVIVNHHEALQNLVMPSAMSVGNQKAALVSTQILSFDALGQRFELSLEANQRLTGAAAELVATDVGVYQGQLVGVDGSWTRIVVADGLPRGLIWNGQELFAMEVPGDSQIASTGPVIYRLADSYVVPNSMSCGTGDLHPTGEQAFATIVSELQTALASAPGATSEITVGMVGDFEFSDSFGANATAAIMTRLNNIDGIFSEQLGIQITVPTIDIFTNAADPFSDALEAGDLLDEVGDYRVATPSQNAQGLTHLYTGKDLTGTTVGVAFLGAVCSNRFGVGLSEARRGATTDSLIAAHEIGHNFGAPHDGESGSACESTTGNFLMSPNVTGVDQFSQCSIDEMQPEIASANGQCLFPLSNVDVAVSANSANLTTAVGSNFDVTFNVDNSSGGDTANNVNVSAQVGTEFSLQSATPSAGSCTSGAGSVDCQLGSIPSGAGRNVVLNLSAGIIGTTNLSASITADQDNNSSNNTASARITITPSVDMTVAAAAATQVTVNQSASLQIQVDNLSSGAATNVAVTITLDAGLRVDTVDWSVGNCSVVNQQVDCQSSSLLGPATATIQLDVTGISQGQQSYSASVTADEPDPSNGNNSATGTVTVNVQQAAGGDGDSTGPMNPGLLVALFSLAALRRRSTPH